MEGNVRTSGAIPGAIVNSQSSQLLVSSGIPTLDQLLGGGLPVGSVILLEEDAHGLFAKVLLKYFLAEGVVNKQSLFVCSKDVNPENIVKDLPALINTDPEPDEKLMTESNKMTIAFRYHNLPTKEEMVQQHFGHYYDLSKNMPEESIKDIDITYWNGCSNPTNKNCFNNPEFIHLLEPIKYKLKEDCYNTTSGGAKSILRVALHSLASPLWFKQQNDVTSLNSDLNLFIYALRGLMRSHNALAFVTVPSHLYEQDFLYRCIHSSDIVLRLESFGGTQYENTKSLSEYHGFFHVTKVSAINSLISKHPGTIEYVFKLKKKKFKIQKLHLPPDIQDSNDNHQVNKGRPEFACGGGSSNKLLDF